MQDDARPDDRRLDSALTLATIQRLQEDRCYRDSSRLFFVEGVRNFIAAADNRCSIHALFYSEKLLKQPVARMLVRRLMRAGVSFARVTPEQFRIVSGTERASGIGVVLRQRVLGLEQVNPDDRLCWTVLGRVRSPGNFGTLLRTSAAVGGGGFILLDQSVDPYDKTVVRASMGALFNQKIVRANFEQLRQWLRTHRLQVIAASPDGAVDYDKICYTRPAVLMLGGERKGLSKDQRLICDRVIRIPMVGGMDSLNLSVAGSLLMYQVFRSSQ
jgi:RNA methyltransferase, TrmH family